MAKSRTKAIARLVVMFAMGWFATTQIAGIGLFDVGAFVTLMLDNPEVAGTAIASAAAKVWSWWKNNNMTIAAETSQAIKDELVAGESLAGPESDLPEPESEEE